MRLIASRMWERFLELVLVEDFQFSEFQSGLIEIMWGIWMLLPWDYTKYVTAVKVLRPVVQPYAISDLMIGLGLIHIWALLERRYSWRKMATFASVGLWGFMSIVLGQIAPQGLAFPSAIIFMVGATWCLFRLQAHDSEPCHSQLPPHN